MVLPSGANAICELVDMIFPITKLFLNRLLVKEQSHLQEAVFHIKQLDFVVEQLLVVTLSN
jgi:hypothetical protein